MMHSQNAVMQNQMLDQNFAQMASYGPQSTEKDTRPRLSELIMAAQDAIENLDGAIGNLQMLAGPLLDGEPVALEQVSIMLQGVNPPYVDELMRIVQRIQGLRMRVDGMATRLRI